jgi:hypothetical protein
MATWKVGDVTVKSGGKVFGQSEDARILRRALETGAATFYLEAPPDCRVVDPSSDWVLDRYLREYAYGGRLAVETDYVPRDEDIPPHLAEELARLAANPRDPNVIY